MMDYWKIL